MCEEENKITHNITIQPVQLLTFWSILSSLTSIAVSFSPTRYPPRLTHAPIAQTTLIR